MQVPTVRICHPTRPWDFLTINAEDFDPAKHRRWTAEDADERPSPPAIEELVDETGDSAPKPTRRKARRKKKTG